MHSGLSDRKKRSSRLEQKGAHAGLQEKIAGKEEEEK